MSCLCGDKHDKCLISRLNIYGQNSRKGKARTTAQEQGTEEQAGPCYGCTLTQPPYATTQLCPFLTVQFPPLPPLQAVIPESLHLSKQEQFHENRDSLATWSRTDVAVLPPSLEGWEGLEHLCLWVRCCETPCTLLQGVRLQHPRELSSLEA